MQACAGKTHELCDKRWSTSWMSTWPQKNKYCICKHDQNHRISKAQCEFGVEKKQNNFEQNSIKTLWIKTQSPHSTVKTWNCKVSAAACAFTFSITFRFHNEQGHSCAASSARLGCIFCTVGWKIWVNNMSQRISVGFQVACVFQILFQSQFGV